jgi:hypothetical protein
MTDRWDAVEDALSDARLVAWDECHKIYLALDDTEADWFRTSGYTIVEGDPADLLATLHRWWDESCFLRFISGVVHNAEDPNAGFTALIPQGADEGEWDDEGEDL